MVLKAEHISAGPMVKIKYGNRMTAKWNIDLSFRLLAVIKFSNLNKSFRNWKKEKFKRLIFFVHGKM